LVQFFSRYTSSEDCVFNLFDESGIIISNIVIHVDDSFVTGSSEEMLDEFLDKLKIQLGDIQFDTSSQKLHRGIAQLFYLGTHVRPNILCAVIFLTSRVQKLTVEDLDKFMNILYYLNGSIELCIMLGGDSWYIY
jgi:hypothetical protein